MPITLQQRAAADARQLSAAEEPAGYVRLVAGPGTGKSKTIEKRVAYLLRQHIPPNHIVVISFTRTTCRELQSRISNFCAGLGGAADVRVSTMHALALRLLRMGNLLGQLYPSDPAILDNWESKVIYDQEFARYAHCTPTRATEIRHAHDTRWQTLDGASLDQAEITHAERTAFTQFHSTRSNLYSCVLPGELIYKCVDAIEKNAIDPELLPRIDDLVVDEFQDLNACDQRFVRLLVDQGARLYIAGDDDQSIYSFRHADPSGIVEFDQDYEGSVTHELIDCFRCAPAILNPASQMIAVNPNRIPKNLSALYGNAQPPVHGHLHVWRVPDPEAEALAIASSCRKLINRGVGTDQILILISDRDLQLDTLTTALDEAELPYDAPAGQALANDPVLRSVYCILRILNGAAADRPDYMAHRGLLSTMDGVGMTTQMQIANRCIENNQNFHDLFHLARNPAWLNGRAAGAVQRIEELLAGIAAWNLDDTLADRAAELADLMALKLFNSAANIEAACMTWTELVAQLPAEMTLGEMLELLSAVSESEQESVVARVRDRLQLDQEANEAAERRIRILTMHGAKGLSGRVVFIPSAEQGVMPRFRAIQAAGLLIEARRLFYVSLTRAMAACVITHPFQRIGASAQRLVGMGRVRLARSQFLAEMGVASETRQNGLADDEAQAIADSIVNLGLEQ